MTIQPVSHGNVGAVATNTTNTAQHKQQAEQSQQKQQDSVQLSAQARAALDQDHDGDSK